MFDGGTDGLLPTLVWHLEGFFLTRTVGSVVMSTGSLYPEARGTKCTNVRLHFASSGVASRGKPPQPKRHPILIGPKVLSRKGFNIDQSQTNFPSL